MHTETKPTESTKAPRIPLSKQQAAIAAVVLIAIYLISNNVLSAQVVQSGDTVSLNYVLSLSNGTVIQSTIGAQPFQFVVGANQVIPGFDNGVIGMKVNQTKTIVIPAAQAYGPVNPALILNVPVNDFGTQTPKVGMQVFENTSTQQFHGVVIAMNSNVVTVNFNPPLAGQNLTFTITILAIKPK